MIIVRAHERSAISDVSIFSDEVCAIFVHLGDARPGDVSHALRSAAVSFWRTRRIRSSRSAPGGMVLACFRRALGLVRKQLLKEVLYLMRPRSMTTSPSPTFIIQILRIWYLVAVRRIFFVALDASDTRWLQKTEVDKDAWRHKSRPRLVGTEAGQSSSRCQVPSDTKFIKFGWLDCS
jgi:hypothetical protein